MSLVETLPDKRKITTKPRPSDLAFRGVVTTFGLINLLILTLIGAFLLFRGLEVLKNEGIGFLTNQKWDIVLDENGNQPKGMIGLGSMLSGTILISFVALSVALPISVLTALGLNFYAPVRIKGFLITMIDLMAAFPSILFGMWGFFVLMPSAEYWALLLNRYFSWIPKIGRAHV